MQSTNEELETSKEELQSTNEELNTLNDELRNRNLELGHANDDLGNLLDAIRIPILLIGADLRIRRLTSLAGDVFHVLPSDVGRPITDIRDNLQAPDLAKLIRQTVNDLIPIQREVQDAEGHWRSLEIRPYRTADNRIEGAVLALPDIDRLKHAEEYLKQIIDNVPASLLVLDGELKVLLANSTFCSEFRVSQTETVGKLLYHLGNQQWNISPLRELLEEVLPQKKAVKEYSVTHVFPEIGTRTMLVSARRIENGNSPAIILLAIGDVTEREEAEEKLRLSNERFRMIADNMSQLAWTCDELGNTTWYNQRWLDYTGMTFGDMAGWGWSKVQHPDHLERVIEGVKRARDTGEVWEDTFPLRSKDGTYRWFLSRAIPIRGAHGKVVQWFGTNTDITKSRQTEAALIKSEKLAAAGRLAAVLAHEINNPLQAVTNVMSLLEQSTLMDPQDHELVKTAIDELGRVNRLTQQSLRFYRESVSATTVNIVEEIESVLELYAKRITAKNITVTKQYRANGASIDSHPGEIRQIFSTLLINALEAVPSHGRFALRVSHSTDWRRVSTIEGLRITLADSGCGIPPDDAARIFEPFFTTKGESGTGLGLWVARGIADRLGGSIQMRSRVHPDNGGTCFSIFLPRRSRTAVS